MRLEGKIALITGAAGGQGQAAAHRFAAEGAKVALTDIDADKLDAVAASVRSNGGAVFAQAADIAEPASVEAMVAAALNTFGRLDILYNNAGINTGGSAPADRDTELTALSIETWNKVIAVNLTGTFLCSKYAIPAIVAAGGGSVINLSSTAALVGGKVSGHAYAASKGGIVSMTKAMAAAYADDNVRVNAICPGSLDFIMVNGIPRDDARLEMLTSRFPLKRLGTVDDVMHLAVFLASDESTWITGAAIPLDGGMTAV